jgi:isopenicillin N synthase-like dioxygenase
MRDSLVVNVGDALEHNTGCLFKSVPHRVKHTCRTNRMSFPFFFDASFTKRMVCVASQLPEGAKDVVHVFHRVTLLTLVLSFESNALVELRHSAQSHRTRQQDK